MRILSLLLVIFSSCSFSSVPPHIAAADRVSEPYMKRICATQNLSILGSGGRMMRCVEDISVSFIGTGNYTLDEARYHFLAAVVPFVKEISNSQDLKQYLAHPDHPENAAQVSITFVDHNEKPMQRPYIAHVIMVNGRISYSVSDGPNTAYRSIHRETYQEALEKLNYETNNI